MYGTVPELFLRRVIDLKSPRGDTMYVCAPGACLMTVMSLDEWISVSSLHVRICADDDVAGLARGEDEVC